MAKRRAESQIDSLIPNHQKSRIALIYLCTSGMQHIVGKLSTRATTFFRPHYNRRPIDEVMDPKSHKSQF
jgi:hypothetical protein